MTYKGEIAPLNNSLTIFPLLLSKHHSGDMGVVITAVTRLNARGVVSHYPSTEGSAQRLAFFFFKHFLLLFCCSFLHLKEVVHFLV